MQSPEIPDFPYTIKTADLLVVDFALLSQNDSVEKTKLRQAATTHGFFYLKNHGVESSFLFDLAPSVFSLLLSEKMKYDMGTTGYYLGYKPRGTQYVDALGKPDMQEYYNIAKDEILGSAENTRGHPAPIYRQWENLQAFTSNSHKVATTILRVLGEAFGLDAELLPSLHKIDRASGDHARITWTPSVDEKDFITFGGHTDFGSVTLLFNRLGGLQAIQPGETEWKYIRPVPDCAIVNFGDCIVKLLGGKILSGMHRVVRTPGDQANLDRVSTVYFSRPNGDILLRSLVDSEPGTTLEEEKPMTANEWIKHRAVHRNTLNYKGKESFLKSKGTEHRDLDQ